MKFRLLTLIVLTLTSACHMPGFPGRRGPRVPGPSLPTPGRFVPGPSLGAPPVGVPSPASVPGRIGRRRYGSPFYRPRPVHVPASSYRPGGYVPYYPYWSVYRPIVETQETQAEVEVPSYQAPKSLKISFGEPTVGVDADVIGRWTLDARRSAAVLEAWLTHLVRAHGSNEEVEIDELEEKFEQLDARLRVHADGSYELNLEPQDDDGDRLDWDGRWSFAEGVLDLSYAEDVDGIPMESENVYEFNYYANDKFTGLVVVNHGLGLVFVRE